MTDSTEMRALAEKLRQHIVTIIDGEWRLPFSVDDLEEAAAALSALAAERDELARQLSEADGLVTQLWFMARRDAQGADLLPPLTKDKIRDIYRRIGERDHAARQPAAENKEG